MLNLKRGTRVFSVMLVAVMLFAAAFAVVSFSSAEKSNGEMLLGVSGTGNVKLSAEESVDTSVIYTGGIFDNLEIYQDSIASITVKGKVNSGYDSIVGSEVGGVTKGDVGVRIGEDPVKSHIMELDVKDDGTFELVFVLNTVFCSEYDNKIPVIVSYTVDDGQGIVTEIPFVIGVITYDYESGMLGYPAGAEYISGSGVKALTAKYVPADAAKDGDGKVTVMYQSSTVTFKANPTPVADVPSGDIGAVIDFNGTTATLESVVGLEYGYLEVGGSITDGYGKVFNWKKAEAATMVIENLKPGVTYTFWVRTPGVEDQLLASAPVLLSRCDTLTAEDSAAKDAFLKKYAEVVVNGDELYSTADPEVKATKENTLQLLSLYNALSDEVKALDVINEKGTYLVISNYLAKHQGIVNAAKTADSYADLRADYSYVEMNEAFEDFFAVMSDIKASHLADENDGKFAFDLSIAVQKIYVLIPVDAVDPAKDLKYEAVDYIIDTVVSEYSEMSADAIEDLYDGEMVPFFEIARDEANLFLFIKKYEDIISADERNSIADLEGMLTEMMELEVNGYEGYMIVNGIYEDVNESLCELYVAELDKLLAKYDENDDIYEYLVYVKGDIKEVIPGDPDDTVEYLDFPDNKYSYDAIVRYASFFDTYDSAISELEGLKNGRSDQDIDIIDGYISNVVDIYYYDFDMELLYANEDADSYLGMQIDAIKAEVTKAKTQLAFIDKKAAAKAEIEAMKDNNTAVIDAANKYLPEIDQIEYDYNNVDSLNANIDAVVAAAKAETDFEKKRVEVKNAIAADVTDKKASGRYSAAQIAQLEAILAAAKANVDNADYAAGKTVADLEAEQTAAIGKLAAINVITVSAGSVPYSGDLSAVDYAADYNLDDGLWGNVTNMNGFGSALTLNIKKVATEDNKFKVKNVSVATGELSDEAAITATKNKAVLLKLNISLGEPAVSGDNGLYTVKVLLPTDLRGANGLYVVSQSGDTTYVYETTIEGNYIVFKTADFASEFLVVGDKTVSLTWLVVLLSVLLVAEIAVIVFFIVKKKKGAVTAAFVPFLALAYVPAGVVPATMILGTLAVIGAAAATTTAVQCSKKKKI